MVNLVRNGLLAELNKCRLRKVSIRTRVKNRFPGLLKREGYLKKSEIIIISSVNKIGQIARNMIRLKELRGNTLFYKIKLLAKFNDAL